MVVDISEDIEFLIAMCMDHAVSRYAEVHGRQPFAALLSHEEPGHEDPVLMVRFLEADKGVSPDKMLDALAGRAARIKEWETGGAIACYALVAITEPPVGLAIQGSREYQGALRLVIDGIDPPLRFDIPFLVKRRGLIFKRNTLQFGDRIPVDRDC